MTLASLPWDKIVEVAATVGGVVVASYKASMAAHEKRAKEEAERQTKLEEHLKRQDEHMARQDQTLEATAEGVAKHALTFAAHVVQDDVNFKRIYASLKSMEKRMAARDAKNDGKTL